MKPRVFTILLAMTIPFTVLTSYASADTDSAAREKVQRLFESDEEKIAQDAIWIGDVFKVDVFDDGSNRDEYAANVCTVLSDHGIKGKDVSVMVVDYTKLLETRRTVVLGQTNCQ